MNDKEKVKFQYKLQNVLMIIDGIIGIIGYLIHIYTILFGCLGMLVILFIVMRFWANNISNKYFNGKKPLTKEDIMNL